MKNIKQWDMNQVTRDDLLPRLAQYALRNPSLPKDLKIYAERGLRGGFPSKKK